MILRLSADSHDHDPEENDWNDFERCIVSFSEQMRAEKNTVAFFNCIPCNTFTEFLEILAGRCE